LTPKYEDRQQDDQLSRAMEGPMMSCTRFGSLGLALILIVSAARAGDDSWRAVPVGGAKDGGNASSSSAAPGVSLDRPVILQTPRPPTYDSFSPSNSGVRPASYSESVPPAPLVRGQSADASASTLKKPSVWGEPVGSLPPGTIVSGSVPVSGRVIAASDSPVVPMAPPTGPEMVTAPPMPTMDGCDPGCGLGWGPLCRVRNWIRGCFDGPCCDDGCSSANCFYADAEYLLWAIKGAAVPPLVTIGTGSNPTPVLGMPGTQVLFGGNSIGGDARSGARVTLGFWCDDCRDFAIEGSYFFLGQQSTRFSASSDGSTVLGRPFFNPTIGSIPQADAELVAAPFTLAGTVNVALTTRLDGAEANFRANLCRSCCSRTDLLFGFRYVGLTDNLQIGEALTVIPPMPGVAPPVPVGTTFVVSDRFSASNNFYGGQVGTDTEYRRGRWFLDLKGKVALGSNHEVVTIGGNTIATAPGAAPANLTGGLLALPSNIGRFSRDMFVVAPEATINLGYQVTPGVRVFVGYNILYLSNVVRAGNQIDTVVNPTLIPSTTPSTPSLPSRPAFAFKGTDFWAQGVNFGLEYRY
jgi:hypothetical protein